MQPAAAIESPLCDASCASKIDSAARTKTASGLEYVDIVVGNGPQPRVGYQVTVNYVAMTPEGKAFDSSLEKGFPYDIRVGAGQVIAGLDEGVLGMKVGGVRRLYIPGNLAFPKGLPSGPGRPRVPPSSPVVFDVQLITSLDSVMTSNCASNPCNLTIARQLCADHDRSNSESDSPSSMAASKCINRLTRELVL